MNAEHLLDAIGLLDDGLIREAEEYVRPRARIDYRRWGTLAACYALVLALGYGAIWLGTGGDIRKGLDWNGASGGAASAPSDQLGGISNGGDGTCGSAGGAGEPPLPEPDSPSGSAPAEPEAPGAQAGDNCPAIMVDGVLYFFTGEPVPVEPDPDAVRTAVSYTSGTPEMDGQTNFSQDLSAKYAMVQIGGEWDLVVLMDGEWILFDAVSP